MLLGMAAVVLIAGIGWLNEALDDRYERTATDLETGEGPGSDRDWGDATPAPVTTIPPVTTRPPTSTSPPTTATTTAPPPTTAAPVPAAAQIEDIRAGAFFGVWLGSANVRLTGDDGSPVVGAEVDVRIVEAGGSSRVVTVVTDAGGRASISVGPYGGWYPSVSHVDIAVASVRGEGFEWDGTAVTATIRP